MVQISEKRLANLREWTLFILKLLKIMLSDQS